MKIIIKSSLRFIFYALFLYISLSFVQAQNTNYKLFFNDRNLSLIFDIEIINDSSLVLSQKIINQNDSLNILLSPAVILDNPEITIYGRKDMLFIYSAVRGVGFYKLAIDPEVISIKRKDENTFKSKSKFKNLRQTTGIVLWVDYVLESNEIKNKITPIRLDTFNCNDTNKNFTIYSIRQKDYGANCRTYRIEQENVFLNSNLTDR